MQGECITVSSIHKHRSTFYTVTCNLPYSTPSGRTQCNASQTYPSKQEAIKAKRAHDEYFHPIPTEMKVKP
jgi:hypothetical protein